MLTYVVDAAAPPSEQEGSSPPEKGGNGAHSATNGDAASSDEVGQLDSEVVTVATARVDGAMVVCAMVLCCPSFIYTGAKKKGSD